MRNRFTWSEWSGAVGDLGTTLPIAFALVEASGFAPSRLFLMWGLVYVATGAYYRIPVSVQPLKAMAVIAITSGVGVSLLSTTAVFYGVLLLVLVVTGLVQAIDDWFSAGLVRGVQFGIGLLLAEKALGLIVDHSVYLGQSVGTTTHVALGTGLVIVLVGVGVRFRLPVALLCAGGGVGAAVVFGVSPGPVAEAPLVDPGLPDWTQFGTALTVLMIPQLPLTLGNAVYAAMMPVAASGRSGRGGPRPHASRRRLGAAMFWSACWADSQFVMGPAASRPTSGSADGPEARPSFSDPCSWRWPSFRGRAGCCF